MINQKDCDLKEAFDISLKIIIIIYILPQNINIIIFFILILQIYMK